MRTKDLKINFRYLCGNIACMSVDSVNGEKVHNDINNEEAIILFNSLVGEKEGCKTVKTLLEENQELEKQQKEFIKYLEDEIYTIEPKGTGIIYNCEYDSEEEYINAMKEQSKLNTLKNILSKYKEIVGDK